jgi:hypothetical protein
MDQLLFLIMPAVKFSISHFISIALRSFKTGADCFSASNNQSVAALLLRALLSSWLRGFVQIDSIPYWFKHRPLG